jgi:hypothetical protein
MDCKTCADLLFVYKLAVTLYLNAEHSVVSVGQASRGLVRNLIERHSGGETGGTNGEQNWMKRLLCG